jgi:hypothetical protein
VQEALGMIERKELTKKQASKTIEYLLTLPKVRQNVMPPLDSSTAPKVRNGRYAINASEIGDGSDTGIRFYQVRTPDQGRWAGYTFVDQMGSDTPYPIRNKAYRTQVLTALAKDPAKYARMYGRYFKTCSECGRGLTNRVSRLLDIGPICGGHFHDPQVWESIRDEAKRALEAAGLDPSQDVTDEDDLDAIREQLGW